MMNKFQVKSFEMEVLGEVYANLEGKKDWYKRYNTETEEFEMPEEDTLDFEKIKIIDEIMKKIEKMI